MLLEESYVKFRVFTVFLCAVRLKGTKQGCGQGGCGACTIMISHFDSSSNKPTYPLHSCLVTIYSSVTRSEPT